MNRLKVGNFSSIFCLISLWHDCCRVRFHSTFSQKKGGMRIIVIQKEILMNKLSLITLVVLAFAAAASAATKTPSYGHQCVPEPITMLALIPGVAMFIRRRKQA
jgi:hypothetical protein